MARKRSTAPASGAGAQESRRARRHFQRHGDQPRIALSAECLCTYVCTLHTYIRSEHYYPGSQCLESERVVLIRGSGAGGGPFPISPAAPTASFLCSVLQFFVCPQQQKPHTVFYSIRFPYRVAR